MTTADHPALIDADTTHSTGKVAIACAAWVSALSIGLAAWVPLLPATSPTVSDPSPRVVQSRPVESISNQPDEPTSEKQPSLGGGYFGPLHSD